MIQKISLLVISLYLSFGIQAQETYNILYVKSNLQNSKTGKPLAKGDKIKSNDPVKFVDKDAVAVVYSLSRGRFKLLLNSNQKTNNEFNQIVQNVLVAQTNSTLTRGAKINSLKELQTHFMNENKPYLILGDRTDIEINPEVIEKFGKGFFFIRYDYVGEPEPINKKLPLEGNKLSLIGESIFSIDGKPIDSSKVSNIFISYFIEDKNVALYLNNPEIQKHLYFKPVFLSDEFLKEIGLYLLVELDKEANKSEVEIIKHILEYLGDYGKADKEQVNDWYQANFK